MEGSSAINVIHQLDEGLPQDAERWCRPEWVVKYGEPADIIGVPGDAALT